MENLPIKFNPEPRRLTDEQKSLLIEWIVDGKLPKEIKSLADRNNFEVSDGTIQYYKKVCATQIKDTAKSDYLNLGLHVGLARRAKRIELRDEMVQRMIAELIDPENETGLDMSKAFLLKHLNGMLDSINTEMKSVEGEPVKNIKILTGDREFDPAKMTEEELKQALGEVTVAINEKTINAEFYEVDNAEGE